MNKGTVKWFNVNKGYGFIAMEDGTDIFVHHTGINMEGVRSLEKGDTVVFDVVDGAKGKIAVNVSRTSLILQVNENEAYKITLLG